MTDSNGDISEFFREVQRVISTFGIDQVMEKLREISHEDQSGLHRDVCDFIVLSTALHFGVSKKDVLFSSKRGAVSDARRMCYALMKEHIKDISDEKIGSYFGGKSRQIVNRTIKDLPLNQKEHTTKDEAKFVEDFLVLTTKVMCFRNSYQKD